MQWNQAPRKAVQSAAVKGIKFVKASHGARDESLAEALCPEADFDPRDPADWDLNEDAEDTLLQILRNLVTIIVDLNNFGYLHSIPL